MFGPGDALFGTLADIVRLLPVVPLIGGGRTRLQPVYVEDVAQAIVRMLTDRGTAGRTYELAGPGVYTLRELVGFALRLMDKRRLLVPVPFAVAEIQARLFEFPPSPPLTLCRVSATSTSGHRRSRTSCQPMLSAGCARRSTHQQKNPAEAGFVVCGSTA